MSKRQRMRKNTARHIKTSHKKATINRKVTTKKVDNVLKNINHIISKQMDKQKKLSRAEDPQNQPVKKIELESISAEDLRKLISGQRGKQRQRSPKINIDESFILQKLMKKWGTNFDSMSKDIKLNKMQWTAKQIQKKYQAYQKIVQQEEADQ